MFYYAIKNLHITCVVLSAAGFLLRGLWMMTGNPLLQHRLTRILPHLVDTTLLLSAITLTVLIQQYPFVAGWATAKILGLIVYILPRHGGAQARTHAGYSRRRLRGRAAGLPVDRLGGADQAGRRLPCLNAYASAQRTPCWCWMSFFSPAGSSSFTCFCCTEISPSSWKREKARDTVSSLSPR